VRTNQQKQQMYALALAALGLVSGAGAAAAEPVQPQQSPQAAPAGVSGKKVVRKKAVLRGNSGARRVVTRRVARRAHHYRVGNVSGVSQAINAAASRGNVVTEVGVVPFEEGTRIVIEGTKPFVPQVRTLSGGANATVITVPGTLREGVGYKSVRQNGVWNVRYAAQTGGTVQVVANTRQALDHVMESSPDGKRWEIVVLRPGGSAMAASVASAAPRQNQNQNATAAVTSITSLARAAATGANAISSGALSAARPATSVAAAAARGAARVTLAQATLAQAAAVGARTVAAAKPAPAAPRVKPAEVLAAAKAKPAAAKPVVVAAAKPAQAKPTEAKPTVSVTRSIAAAVAPAAAPKVVTVEKAAAPAPVAPAKKSAPAAAAKPDPFALTGATVASVATFASEAPAPVVSATTAVAGNSAPSPRATAAATTTGAMTVTPRVDGGNSGVYPSLLAKPGSAATIAAAAAAKAAAKPSAPAPRYVVKPLSKASTAPATTTVASVAKPAAEATAAKPAAAKPAAASKQQVSSSAAAAAATSAAASAATAVSAAQSATATAAISGATATLEQLEERRVSLDFVAADINDVLKALSLQSGINIVTGADVKGNVTVSLKRVSMTEALDMIARLSGFQYARFGSAYVVGTPASVNAIISGGSRAGAPVTEFIRYRYTSPANLHKALSDKFPGINLPEPDKDALASPAAPKLLVLTDTKERVDAVKAFVEQMEQAVSLPSVGAATEIYEVKYANVTDLVGILARLVPTVSAQPGPTPGFVSNASGASATFSSETVAPAGLPAAGGAAGGAAGAGGGGNAPSGGPAATGGNTAGNKGPRVLLLTGAPADIARAREVLNQIDIKVPQIVFEARVMDVNREDLQRLGLRYDFGRQVNIGESNADANRGAVGQPNLASEFPGRTPNFGAIYRSPYTVGLTLDALANNNRGKVLSNPNLSALDGESATAFIGDQIKYVVAIQQTPQGQTVQTETATVGITLKVTGKASPDGAITLYVHPEVSTISSFLSLPNGVSLPQIATRFVDSTVRVKDGETIAIGGLIKEDDIKNLQKVPFLGDLPFFGQLFRRSDVTKRRSEVVVFITARIVKD